MQLELSKEQEHKLKAFSEVVIERNKLHNLTAYKNTQAFFNDQIVDCVLALKACKKNLQNTVVDCGSGAGLPSIIWAMLEPEKTFYSIDKNIKKIQFQKQTIVKLGLKNIEAHTTKIENFTLDDPHTVVLKAFGPIKNTTTQLKHRQHQKNLIFLKKDNKKTEEELLEASALLYDYKKHQYVLNKEKMVALELYDSKNSHN